jgi:hypothetical protein
MRTLVLLCVVLGACAQPEKQTAKILLSERPKPAIREQLVPGMTFGNVELQRMTLDEIKGAMLKEEQHSACSLADMSVSDTWPLSEPSPSKFSNAFIRWTELWTFETCSGSVDVEIVYMLHKKSDIINVSVSKLSNGQVLKIG